MKALNWFFCISFIGFAVLQYNDPDPYIWIPIYLFASLLCFFATRNKYNFASYLIGLSIYTMYAIYLFFSENGVLKWITVYHAENIAGSMHANKPWIEETREFFGLLIVIIVLSLNFFYFSKSNKMTKQ